MWVQIYGRSKLAKCFTQTVFVRPAFAPGVTQFTSESSWGICVRMRLYINLPA